MKSSIILLVLFLAVSCKTKTDLVFHNLNEFNLADAKIFVKNIQTQPQILSISIVDANHNKNGFLLNRINIFNDTIQTNQANFYSYKKLAHEINIDHKELNKTLLQFDKMNVSEFVQEKDFYLFPVEKYALNKQNGYVYLIKSTAKIVDTLTTKTVYGNKIILKKQLEENWFEYEGL